MIMAPKLGEKWGKNLTTAYGQFMMSDSRRKMILDMYEPACRARLSESELLVLLQSLRTSKVIGLTSDKDKLVKSMRDESISIFILDNREKWKKVPAKAAKGKTVKIQPYPVLKSFRSTSRICLEKLGMTGLVMDSIMVPQMTESLGGLPAGTQLSPQATEFVREFSYELLTACLYQPLKESDLRYCINGIESDYYQKYEKALCAANSQSNLLAIDFIGAFALYVCTYFPHLTDELEKALMSR